MKRLRGGKLPSELLSEHHFVCDLVDVGFPVLSLWTDGRADWLYQWADKSGSKERWLLVRMERAELISYLQQEISQLDAIYKSSVIWLMDVSTVSRGEDSKAGARRTLWSATLDDIEEYLPSEDSFFDPELTDDMDLAKDLVPTDYSLPIDGVWFGQDFQELFRRYQRLYAFFYATGERFVSSVENALHEVLRMPFRGGGSRVNLYTKLSQCVPGVHSLKIDKLQFASPGDIVFEAIPSIGESIEVALRNYLRHEDGVRDAAERIRKGIRDSGQNTVDSSQMSDAMLSMEPERLEELKTGSHEIGCLLDLHEEFGRLRSHAPNTVVFCKALLSLVRQVERLALFERRGMITVGGAT